MRVGAVGNRVLCGFPSPCGRVLGVHRDGSVQALGAPFQWAAIFYVVMTVNRS
jgi:hypothetical protein